MSHNTVDVRGSGAVHLIVGPGDHGVVRFALRLAELMRDQCVHLARPAQDTAAVRKILDLGQGRTVHLHYTDSLYAEHTAAAATAFDDLCRRIDTPVTVTLHDLPDPADEPGRYLRRAESYRAVVRVAAAVAVSSRHELDLLDRLLAASPPAREIIRTVVPLPVEPPWLVDAPERPEPLREVAVFGFVYPGKGHDDVIRAMSRLPPSVGFTALGRISDGHADLHTSLLKVATASNRMLQITGFVPDPKLQSRLRHVGVPVAPARMISASGSINTWIAAGRRPLAADGPYTRELNQSYPGSIELYRPGELPELLDDRLSHPHLTWLDRPLPGHLSGSFVAERYRQLFQSIAEKSTSH